VRSTAPEMQLIAGAFNCIDQCLNDFQEFYTGGASAAARCTELYRCFGKAVSTALREKDPIARFAVPSKALKLLGHHAELFRSAIAAGGCQGAQRLYTLLVSCVKSSKEGLRKHALPALSGSLAQVAAHAAATPAAGRPALDYFLQLWFGELGAAQPDEADAAIAVAGLQAFAPALKSLYSSAEVLSVLQRLLFYGQTLAATAAGAAAAGDDDEQDSYDDAVTAAETKALLRKLDLLNCCACVAAAAGSAAAAEATAAAAAADVAALPPQGALPAAVLAQLQSLAEEIVLGYPALPPRHRAAAQSTLAQLCVGLAGPGLAGALDSVLAAVCSASVLKAGAREVTSRGSSWEARRSVAGQQVSCVCIFR
jgi:hypothetical protein